MQLEITQTQFADAWRLLDAEPELTIRRIQNVVCEYFNLTRLQLLSNRRNVEIVYPRSIAIFLCRDLTGKSLPQIGRAFGRDHTTVLSSMRRVAKLRAENEFIACAVDEITDMLGGAND